jgi:hypothetical protein
MSDDQADRLEAGSEEGKAHLDRLAAGLVNEPTPQKVGGKGKPKEPRGKLWKKPKAFVVPPKNHDKYKETLLMPRRKRNDKAMQGGGHLPHKGEDPTLIHGNDNICTFGRCHRGLLPDIVSSTSEPTDVSAHQKMKHEAETAARLVLAKNLEKLKVQQEKRAELESTVDEEEEEERRQEELAAEKHEIWVNWRKQKDKQLRQKKREKQKFIKSMKAETDIFQEGLKEKAMARTQTKKQRKPNMVNQTVLAKEQQLLAKRIDTAISQVKHSPYTLPLPRLSEARAEYYKQRDEAEAHVKQEKLSAQEARASRRQERKRAKAHEEEEAQAEAKAEAQAFMDSLAEKQQKQVAKQAKATVVFEKTAQEEAVKAMKETSEWEANAQARKTRASVRKKHIQHTLEEYEEDHEKALHSTNDPMDEARAKAMAAKLGLSV